MLRGILNLLFWAVAVFIAAALLTWLLSFLGCSVFRDRSLDIVTTNFEQEA